MLLGPQSGFLPFPDTFRKFPDVRAAGAQLGQSRAHSHVFRFSVTRGLEGLGKILPSQTGKNYV
jgi:hypothetical protein